MFRRLAVPFVASVLLGVGVSVALGAGTAPEVRAGSGSVTLFYAKPFTSCTGADGDTYNEVLNWKGHGTVQSTYPLLNGKRMTDNVDFFQNDKTGKGIVRGSVSLFKGSTRIATGTLAAAWRGNVGGGQIILNPTSGGFYVLNAELKLEQVTNGFNVEIVFGKNAPFNVPPNPTASFNGRACP
jgi:hypothetical protein